MKFEEYMNTEIPTWKTDISLEVISELKEIYNKMEEWKKISDDTLESAFHHNNSGLDYSTDFERARKKLGYYQNLLFDSIYNIKEVINSGKNNYDNSEDQKKM